MRGLSGFLTSMIEDASEQLQKRLRELRRQAGWTQEQLAEKAGLNYKHYQEIERGGKRDIRLSTLECLARAFGMSLGSFFSYTRFAETPDTNAEDDESSSK